MADFLLLRMAEFWRRMAFGGNFNLSLISAVKRIVFQASGGHPDQVPYIIVWEDLVQNLTSWVRPWIAGAETATVAVATKPKVPLQTSRHLLHRPPRRSILKLMMVFFSLTTLHTLNRLLMQVPPRHQLPLTPRRPLKQDQWPGPEAAGVEAQREMARGLALLLPYHYGLMDPPQLREN